MAYQPDSLISSMGAGQTPQQIRASRTAQGLNPQTGAGLPPPDISLTSTPTIGGKTGKTTTQYFSGNTPVTQSQYTQNVAHNNVYTSGGGGVPTPATTSPKKNMAIMSGKTGGPFSGMTASNSAATTATPVSSGGASAGGAPGVGATSTTGGGTGVQATQSPTALQNYYSRLGSGQTTGPATQAYSFLAQPQLKSQQDLYNQYMSQNQNLLNTIQQGYDAQKYFAQQQGQQEMGQASSVAAAHGLMGSPEASKLYMTAGKDTQNAIAQIEGQRAQAVAQIMNQVNTLAQNAYQFEVTKQAPQAVQLQQQQLTQTLQGLARSGVSFDQMANSTDPQVQQTFDNLVKLAGGDPNKLKAQWALNTPNANIKQQWVQGNNVYQLVVDPMTGKAHVQSFDTGVNVPNGWQAQKIGTNGLLMYNPNDMSQQVIYSMDAFGNVQQTVPGQGTTTQGSAGSTVGSSQGAAQSSAISNSNVKASDGGTFANFPSVQDAYNYAGTLITQIANGQNSQYGQAPTFQSFVNKWTNTTGNVATKLANQLGVAPGSNLADVVTQVGMTPLLNALAQNEGGSYKGVQNNPFNIKYTTGAGAATGYTNMQQYGKLAQVPGFNPGPTKGTKTQAQQVDTAAAKYLSDYLNGKMDTTATSLGLSTRQGTGAMMNTIVQRAQQLYNEATGQNLPNATQLQGLNKNLVTNQNLLNNLNTQEGTISRNFGLSLKNMDANNINHAAPAINKILNWLSNQAGSPSTAQYLDQNATLKNELGSLLSIKNASGTTVQDKLSAEALLNSNLSVGQQKQILKTLMQEAQNQRAAIVASNQQIYDQTDPLGINPQNPANGYDYSQMTAAGFTPLGVNEYAAPDGSVWKVNSSGNATQVQ